MTEKGEEIAFTMITNMEGGSDVRQYRHIYPNDPNAMPDLGKFSVVFHSMEPSEAVRVRGEALLSRLGRLSGDIMRGKMVIESRHRHHHQGNVYHVSIKMHLPGLDIEVSHDPELNHAHEDVYVAMRDAFRAARRQLEGHQAKRGAKAARHEQERFENRPEQQAD